MKAPNEKDKFCQIMTSHLDKSSSLICCRCLRTKKKEVRRMPVNSSPLERFAQGGESRNLIKILSDFQTFVIQEISSNRFLKMSHLDKSSSLICCRCLQTKKKEVRRMPVAAKIRRAISSSFRKEKAAKNFRKKDVSFRSNSLICVVIYE